MSLINDWPEDDENTIYIEDSATLADIQQKIEEKWGNVAFNDISITSEYIHTHCLTYDLYDSNDWTRFIVIRRKI